MLTAADVRACLARHWPDSEYLHVAEAPQHADRSGRKLDVLVVSLWQSRGLQLDGVEVKVSLSDWRRELKDAAKADWWWQHVHRFWIAVPASLADAVLEDLPAGWGLLSCELGAAAKVVRKAERHDPKPLPWSACVGIMRAAAASGFSALERARSTGYQQGYRDGKGAAARECAESVAQRELDALRDRVARFEKASGVSISGVWDRPEDEVALVTLVRAEMNNPGWTARQVGGAAKRAVEAAESLVKQARDVQRIAERVSEALAGAVSAAHPADGDQEGGE